MAWSKYVIGLMVVAVIGCGGATGAIPASMLPPDESDRDLYDRVDAAYAALNAGDWSALYNFTSVRFREDCTRQVYAAGIDSGFRFVFAYMNLDGSIPFEWAITRIDRNGERAAVFADAWHSGRLVLPPGVGSSPDRWVLIDGEWWQEPDAGPLGC